MILVYDTTVYRLPTVNIVFLSDIRHGLHVKLDVQNILFAAILPPIYKAIGLLPEC